MKITKIIPILITALFLASCGGIQKARYYQPTNANEKATNEEWGDGVATTDKDVCVWVGDDTALYLPMMAGPIGFPIFPLGVLVGEIDRLGFFELSVWIVPAEKEDQNPLRFDPTNTFLEFENGITKQPQTVEVTRFKTEWKQEHDFWGRKRIVERISYPERWGFKPLSDFNEPIELWDWSRFVLRFEKPDKNIGPRIVEIKGLEFEDDQERVFRFSFSEVEKHRYLYSGKDATGEWMDDSPATPCRKLFEKMK